MASPIQLAYSPNTHPDTLHGLAVSDPDNIILIYIARNPSSAPKTLELLATYDHEWLRWELIQNPNTPDWVRTALSIYRF